MQTNPQAGAANHPALAGPVSGLRWSGCCCMLLADWPSRGAPAAMRQARRPRSWTCERFEIRKLFGIAAPSCDMKGLIKHARSVTGSLVRIIMPPLFRPSPAPVACDKGSLRWPGPFGSGFLSPQPPGIVGIGPIAGSLTGPTRVGPFLFCRRHFAYAIRAVARKQPPAVASDARSSGFSDDVSAAWCRPRPAWGPACRDCRPGHRRPRRRRPCGRSRPPARSSFSSRHSSRRPSTGCEPRCSR
jgi:hypothetical protein